MIRKDYLVRKIEEFGKVLSRLHLLKRERQLDEFGEALVHAFNTFSPFEISEFEALNEEEFSVRIIGNEHLTQEQFRILADLIYEKMDHYSLTGNDSGAAKCRQKCIQLYQKLLDDNVLGEFDLHAHYRLSSLMQNS